jgi:uncharacterized glyoxalase superfamily protein PhnB
MTAVGRFRIPDPAWVLQKLSPLLALASGLGKLHKRRAADLAGSGLIPALRYRDLDRAIDWLCAAFGFEQRDVVAGRDGRALYAYLTRGSNMILVRAVGASALDELMRQPDEIGGAETQSCYLVVEDADAHCRQASAVGADILLDVADDDHGGRGYSCRDPEGHMWSFGTYDPWQGKPVSQSARVAAAARGPALALSAMLACLMGGAAAGWMLSGDRGGEALLKDEASAARARVEQAEARANQLAEELTRQAAATKAAEQANRQARERMEQEQGGKRVTETAVRELETRLSEQRRAADVAAQTARAEVAKEQAARKEAQRVASVAQQEMAREREARQRAETDARTANERLAQERAARQVAERAANEARKKRIKAGDESAPVKAKASAKATAGEVPTAKSGETEFPIVQP